MSSIGALGNRARRRLAAALVAAAVVAGGLVAAAGARPDLELAPIGPESLLASVIERARSGEPVSGTVSAAVDLGLPVQQLPGASGLGALLGPHDLRVWHSADGLRVADLLVAGERALVIGEDGAWWWDSETFTARRLTREVDARLGALEIAAGLVDPRAVSSLALGALEETTRVRLADPKIVAGRPAYVLVLEPRTTETLIARIEIGVDADERVPLEIQIFGRGYDESSLKAGFASISFEPIEPSTFWFTPPEGAKSEAESQNGSGVFDVLGGGDAANRAPRILGRGWTTVAALPMPARESSSEEDPGPDPFPFTSPLLSADVVESDRGSWLLVGAVPIDALRAQAGRLP